MHQTDPARSSRDVVVVGAGIIGAAIGWRCAQRGLTVTMVDPDPSRGAWRTAAGLLAPVTELHYAEAPLFALGTASLARYADFCTELTALTDLPTAFWRCGTISSAWDGADVAALRDLHAFWRTLGVEADLFTGRELRALEPALAPGLPGGLLARDDHSVDPRLLHAALLRAAGLAGARLLRDTGALRVRHDRVEAIVMGDGTVISAGAVVIAAGAWSGSVAGLPSDARPAVRPVKGQTVLLRPARPVLQHVVRASVQGNHVYLVPRESGDIVVGASLEEAGFDERPRAGAVYDILRDALTVVPELAEAEQVEVRTGLRPGSPDNAPLIGESGVHGLLLATGHYRNGVLLTPVTADLVAGYLATGGWDELAAPFAPTRFGAGPSIAAVTA